MSVRKSFLGGIRACAGRGGGDLGRRSMPAFGHFRSGHGPSVHRLVFAHNGQAAAAAFSNWLTRIKSAAGLSPQRSDPQPPQGVKRPVIRCGPKSHPLRLEEACCEGLVLHRAAPLLKLSRRSINSVPHAGDAVSLNARCYLDAMASFARFPGRCSGSFSAIRLNCRPSLAMGISTV